MEERFQAKRRKVRKGTRSCWECKRRKVRCIFSSSSNTICDNCRRRGSTCISQELPDSSIPTSKDLVDARLDRVERILEQLVDLGSRALSSENYTETPPSLGTLDSYVDSSREEQVSPVLMYSFQFSHADTSRNRPQRTTSPQAHMRA